MFCEWEAERDSVDDCDALLLTVRRRIAKKVSLDLERERQPYARVRVLINRARCDRMDLK